MSTTNNLALDLQHADDVLEQSQTPEQPAFYYPNENDFQRWACAALAGRTSYDMPELTIRLVMDDEMIELNGEYRGQQKSTNVLSFPFDAPPGINIELLGDIIISVPVILKEAKEQGKTVDQHWAHMVIHGCLHLLGYDHIDDDEAAIMETLESDILASMGYPNPYKDEY